MTSSTTTVVLEPAAQEFAAATADPPYLFDLGPVEARKTVDEVQSGEVEKPDVEIKDTTVPGGPSDAVSVRILRPKGVRGPAAGDSLFARRRVGGRQSPHPRPPGS